jgi:hypothetical protein
MMDDGLGAELISPQCPLDRSTGGPQRQSGCSGEDKNHRTHRELTSRRQSLLSELSGTNVI